MSQANFTVNNGDGAAVRTGFNAAIGAVASCSTGPTQPPEIVPGMLWLDTSVTPALLKRRNAADTAWLLTREAMPNIGGTANAITLALGAGGASIPDGYALTFTPAATNAGAVTINGEPALAMKDGGSAMPAGYLLAGEITRAEWNGSAWLVRRREVTGGNATDGFFRQTEDGFQECWITNARLTFTNTSTISYDWTYPSPFTSDPALFCMRSKTSASIAPVITQVIPCAFTTANNGTTGILEYKRITGFANFVSGNFMDCSGRATGFWY